MPGRLLVVVAIALVALADGTARAQSSRPLGMNRLVLDHAEAQPSVVHGMIELRLFVTAMNLDQLGKVHDLAPDAFELGGSSSVKSAPYVTGRYDGFDDAQTAIAIVVQISGLGPDLEAIKTAIDEELLDKLEKVPNLQVAVIGYGESIEGGNKLTTLAKARTALANLSDPDPEHPTDVPDLVHAVDRAVKALKKAKPLSETLSRDGIRKLVIVVSDGRTADDDQEAVTHLGKAADKVGVRIHTVGYSPPPEPRRRPLFSLGELSKTSQGTFRWVQSKVDETSLRVPFQRLLDEIQHQYVLTLFVSAADPPTKAAVEAELGGKKIKSRELKIKEPWCGGLEEACKANQYCSASRCMNRKAEEGIGLFGYLWRILLAVVALLGLLVGVGFVLTKIREKKEASGDGGPRPIPPPKKPLTGAVAAAPGTGALPAAMTKAQLAMQVPITGPHLYILSGPQTGQRIALQHGFLIGKAADCDLSLEHDGFASSHHAQILMDTAGNATLVDQNSTNGTFINGVRVTQSRLDPGMSIRCGSTELRFLPRP